MPLEPGEAAFAHAMNASNETRQLKIEVTKLKALAKVQHERAKIHRELAAGGKYFPLTGYDTLLEEEERLLSELDIDK